MRHPVARSRMSRPAPLAQLAIAAAVFLLLEALVFRTGLYPSILEPRSHAGQLHHLASAADELWSREGAPEVLLVGDSQIGHAFSARQAERLTRNVRFFNLGVGAGTLRVWWYLLRELDPGADRFRAVVLQLKNYDDLETRRPPSGEAAMRRIEIRLAVPFLRYRDVPGFVAGFAGRTRTEAALSSLLKGYAYQRDFQRFLLGPGDRLARTATYRRSIERSRRRFEPTEESLAGMTYDRSANRFRYSKSFPLGAEERRELEVELRRKPRVRDVSEYNRRWLGAVAAHYQASDTRLVVVCPPRLPFPELLAGAPRNDSSVARGLIADGALTALPEETFGFLERPEYFAPDGIHLNRRGRELFTEVLARRLAEIAGQEGR